MRWKISVGAPTSTAINKLYTRVPSSRSSHLLLTVHAIRAAQLHATLITPQSTPMYRGEKDRKVVLVKSEEEIEGEDDGERRKKGGVQRGERWEKKRKSGIAAAGCAGVRGKDEAREKRKKDRSRS